MTTNTRTNASDDGESDWSETMSNSPTHGPVWLCKQLWRHYR